MSKNLKGIKTVLILPCMCSIAFYMGSQVVTHTEAAFVAEQKVQGAISAAPVFPKTIHVLKEEAKQHEQSILQEYEGMKKELEAHSLEVLEKRLVLWKQQREKIASEREALQNIYGKMESYYNQLTEDEKKNNGESNQQLQSIQADVNFIHTICENVDKSASIQKIDEQIQLLQKQINDEKERKLNEQAKEIEKHQEVPTNTKEPVEESNQSRNVEEGKRVQETDFSVIQN